jgi:hypothetical protein
MLSRKRKKSLSIARAIKMAKKEEMEDGELQIEIDLDNIEIESNKHSDNLIHNSFVEEFPSIGRPRLRYSQQKYKDKMRKEAWDLLKEIAVDEADVEQLLLDILRVYIPSLYEQLSSFSILAENIQSVFETFNEEILSTRKGLLIAAEATKGLKIESAMDLTGYAKSTIYKGLATNEKNKKISPTSIQKLPKEKCVSPEEKFFVDWSWEVAPKGHSNDKKRRFIWITWKEAHEDYNRAAVMNNFPKRSYDWWKIRVDTNKIRKAKFDKYRCPICCEGLIALSKRMKGERSSENDEKIAKYQKHTHLVKTQSYCFKYHKANLAENQSIIVMDYSTIHETAKFKLKDLNFTIYWQENGRLLHQFVDFWSKEKKDYKYTALAFNQLICNPFFYKFSTIFVWSDGGLKTKEILYYISCCAQDVKKIIQVNYFAPYHGHSVCDAHFGAGKRELRKSVGSGVVINEKQVIDCFSKLKNTIEGIQVENIINLPHVTSFPEKIKKWFQFWMNKKGKIYCRTTHLEPFWIQQEINVMDSIEKMKKPELQQYLKSVNVPFQSNALKADLVKIVRNYVSRFQ